VVVDWMMLPAQEPPLAQLPLIEKLNSSLLPPV